MLRNRAAQPPRRGFTDLPDCKVRLVWSMGGPSVSKLVYPDYFHRFYGDDPTPSRVREALELLRRECDGVRRVPGLELPRTGPSIRDAVFHPRAW
jgi:hypothetical protein